MQKIGVFGGAFNPPHKGHIRLACDFADRLSLNKIIIIPTFIPPHKSAEYLASPADRLEMCRLAFGGDPRFEISAMEINRGGKSYTYDTLMELKKIYKQAEFYLIIGSDMFLSFDTWYRYKDIIQMCTICTAARENHTVMIKKGVNAVISDMPALEINSTELRDKRKNGEDIRAFVGEAVAAYIIDRGLYCD